MKLQELVTILLKRHVMYSHPCTALVVFHESGLWLRGGGGGGGRLLYCPKIEWVLWLITSLGTLVP